METPVPRIHRSTTCVASSKTFFWEEEAEKNKSLIRETLTYLEHVFLKTGGGLGISRLGGKGREGGGGGGGGGGSGNLKLGERSSKKLSLS